MIIHEKIKKITTIAVLSAIAFVLMLLEFPVPLMPGFIKMDISEFPALIAAFAFGPVEGVAVCLIKNLLKLSASYSAGVGEIANFILGASFVSVAGIIYKKKPGFKGSLLACLAGSAVMAAISFPANLYIVYPVYSKMMPIDEILKAYSAILPSVGSLKSALLIFNLPFTLIKGLVVSVLSLFSYNRLKSLYAFIQKRGK